MRDVLFLSYFFPPLGGGAVLRAVKFVKYLPAFGWRPLVVAAAGGYHVRDASLEAEIPPQVVRSGVAPPGGSGLAGTPGGFLARVRRRLSRERRRLLCFPDVYTWFARPAYEEARRLLAEHEVEVIFSTAPPYTSHLLASRLAAETGLPLVLDYRDAWTDNPLDAYPTPLHRWRTPRAEARVLSEAAAVTAVTAGMAEQYGRRVPAGCPVIFLPNGYDEADFVSPAPPAAGPFVVAYSGQLYAGRRPGTFFEAAARFVKRRNLGPGDFLVRLVGPIGPGVARRAAAAGLPVEATGLVEHGEAVRAMREADVNLLLIGSRPGAEATLTGKIFEYLRAGRPILALVPPPGEAAALIREFEAGVVVPPDDVDGAERALEELYERRGAAAAPPPPGLERYERRRLAAELAAAFEEVCRER
ncbi:MAG: glycosyltransferase [Candidatus Coatesbacteria bacterium]|nr:MAG: glycosyltransferase [Candidatus Coatesbacteria bacterium]